ncbi:enoyl-CoA hydratase/isomerase family protein [Ramlibacter sp. G-1-2-2]|uniref:Enoyl-CoA hydratase/isomerase family protein n=1 Tax=Ramlibacter agri TaxID=2728837 RepID=A0A848H2M1_9BURK|nr:enoyl-CoA hydratase-related protein [Ramlibacter agri]NML44824.1 enoyl-CoA hydratase/isomerase family protein [Ramlibacter agri]
MTQSILLERRGAALWITINREERRNAINPEVIAGIHEALRGVAADAGIRAVVLTGAGEKAFCAGADLTRGTGVFTEGAAAETTTDFGRLARFARELRVPLIARINGACVAGGMGLMSLCDLCVVADHARFGLPEAKVGVFAMQVLVFLRRMIAPRYVNELCFTGELIDAQRAREMGIANAVVPYAQLDAKVDEMVDRIAACSPMAVQRGRSAIAGMEWMGWNEALTYAETQIAVASASPDAKEGLAAFNEKRAPAWAPKREV